MTYLVGLAAAFLAGALSMAVYRYARRPLQKRFSRLGPLMGKSYEEVLAAVHRSPGRIQRQEDSHTLRTWWEGSYSISLLFDCEDFCLGVMDERF